MKQVLQSPRSGEIDVVEVPAPHLLPGAVLVRIEASLVSAGTERASSEFANKNLWQKAKARPDLVRDAIQKFRRDGILSTAAAVRGRLDQPSGLGYSSAGTIIACGEGVTDLHPGERVACAGAGYAVHAEIANVPRLLVARIPSPSTSFEHAAFTTIGAVALHGIRTSDARFGDIVAVIGLGLLGQLTVQLLKAAGCHVIGLDIAHGRARLAAELGADAVSTYPGEFERLCLQSSSGHGADVVIIAAETASSQPVNLAASVARDRGVVVAVGTVGLDLQRRTYYEKELDFRIPRSYGPGRYDSAYEQKGRDYPIGYVRWTETRNMEAFLNSVDEGKLRLESLITHRFPIQNARSAYELITGKTQEQFLGVLISYPGRAETANRIDLVGRVKPPLTTESVNVGLIGSGAFALSTLLPAMKTAAGVQFIGVCAANGSHSKHAGDKFGFRYCATSEHEILSDPSVNTVAISTRHNLHAESVVSALNAGKHVFCEKPLCLNEYELNEIVQAYNRAPNKPLLMVGFNRRFAPMAVSMKSHFAAITEPLLIHYRVNAGTLPRDHWTLDPVVGGGRILGEVCHFVDFCTFLAGSMPIEVQTQRLHHLQRSSDDSAVVNLRFANGSLAAISYLANGDRSFAKERIEVFGGGSIATLDDFRRLELVCGGKTRVMRSWLTRDKGHCGEWKAFADAILSGSNSPIPFRDIVTVTLATLRANESSQTGSAIAINVGDILALPSEVAEFPS